MDKRILIKIATIIALLLAITWAIFEPSFEPVIASITLAIAAGSLFIRNESQATSPASKESNQIEIDARGYPGAKEAMTSFTYDARIKLWELLEYANDCVSEAEPSNYGKTWLYENASTGEKLHNLGSYAREKGFLEEESKSLLHIGLEPPVTLKVVKL